MSWTYTYETEREDIKTEAESLARHIADFLNVMGNGGRQDKLVESLANKHRTLQQDFMKFIVKWIKYNSETKFFDGRNHASVILCKRLQATIAESPSGGYLPLV